MNIMTIVLVNGDEIVGREVLNDDKYITLEKPVKIALNQKGMGFAPLCISIDDASEFKFKQEHVLFVAPTRQEISEPYIQATTGIQLATSL
jgi:hypothetical protein